jgi:hypothetical protein
MDHMKESLSGRQDQTLKIMHYKQHQHSMSFGGANVMSVYEVTGALDSTKTRIVELEANMRTIKDTLTNEFRKEVVEAKRVHREEMLR